MSHRGGSNGNSGAEGGGGADDGCCNNERPMYILVSLLDLAALPLLITFAVRLPHEEYVESIFPLLIVGGIFMIVAYLCMECAGAMKCGDQWFALSHILEWRRNLAFLLQCAYIIVWSFGAWSVDPEADHSSSDIEEIDAESFASLNGMMIAFSVTAQSLLFWAIRRRPRKEARVLPNQNMINSRPQLNSRNINSQSLSKGALTASLETEVSTLKEQIETLSLAFDNVNSRLNELEMAAVANSSNSNNYNATIIPGYDI